MQNFSLWILKSLGSYKQIFYCVTPSVIFLTEFYRDLCWSGALFTSMSKIARICFGFTLPPCQLAKKNLRNFFYSIRDEINSSRDSLAHVFPRFASASCIKFEFWLVSLGCLCHWWLARYLIESVVLFQVGSSTVWRDASP